MSGAPVTDKHRELARKICDEDNNTLSARIPGLLFSAVGQAIADAEACGYEKGVRKAADIAEMTSEESSCKRAAERILALLPEVTK